MSSDSSVYVCYNFQTANTKFLKITETLIKTELGNFSQRSHRTSNHHDVKSTRKSKANPKKVSKSDRIGTKKETFHRLQQFQS